MACVVTSRSQLRQSIAVCSAVAFACVSLLAPAVAEAAHSARLSADLADHLSVGSQSIRVIVHGTRAEVEALAARYNLQVAKYLQSGAVFLVNAGQLEAMRQDDTQDHLSGDIQIRSSVDAAAVESIGVDQVWARSEKGRGQGKGISVAVIDSGLDTTHNALKGRVLVTRDFTGGDGLDHYGHGTHVAAIIAGQAGRTLDTRDYGGVAPGAYLLNLRVLGDDGSGSLSDVIEAIDWTIEHRREYNVRIINLSLGAPVLQPYRDDPLCEAVERAVRAGLVVVAAAGNFGRSADGKSVYGAITSPANSPYAIAVGAIDTHDTAQRSDDTLATYSSKGPTRYDLVMKPDLAAPGSHIRSAEAVGSYLSTTYPARHVAGTGPNAVMQLSGTSMAAGVVSGAAALVLDARGSLTPRDTKAALQLTSTFLPSAGLVGAGAGMINALAAVDLADTGALAGSTTIANEQIVASRLYAAQVRSGRLTAVESSGGMQSRNAIKASTYQARTHGDSDNDASIWSYWRPAPAVRDNTIVWGVEGNTIIWGGVSADTIVWGVDANTIIWGVNANTIVWGVDADTIVWGVGANTIVWGVGANTIVWGVGANTIVWGVGANTIVWGVDANTIVWGAGANTIVWGVDANTIIWGVGANTIVWGGDE
jgi:serine protease AprX